MIAGVANIAVQPTHTRRGVMTRMLQHQIKDIHERGEPLAALFARESAIYRRFGYGIGSVHERWLIDRHHNGFARPHQSPGRIAFVKPADGTAQSESGRRKASFHELIDKQFTLPVLRNNWRIIQISNIFGGNV